MRKEKRPNVKYIEIALKVSIIYFNILHFLAYVRMRITRTVQPVATCRHSPSPGPSSPYVQTLQDQAE